MITSSLFSFHNYFTDQLSVAVVVAATIFQALHK
jgi:hypothetical protein